jgi:hypothetical protein
MRRKSASGGAPAPPLSSALRERVERAHRARARQVRDIVAHCRMEFPSYAALSAEGLESLRRNADAVVGAFYRIQLLEGRLPTSEELEPQRRVARLRFAQGVPLHEMVGCYYGGLPRLWSDLVASLDAESAVERELLQRVPLTIAAMTLVATAATEAWVGERERQLRTRGEVVDEVLWLFVDGSAPLRLLRARARAIGLDLETARTAVLFRVALGQRAGGSSAVDRVRALLAERPIASDAVIGRVSGGVLALLSGDLDATGLADVAAKLRGEGWRIGVGTAASGTGGLRRSIREATRAIEIGAYLRHPGPLDRYADFAVLDLVDVVSPRAADFARSVLGPLVDSTAGATPLQTLRAFCRSGFRHKVAAADLGVHPHTLSYRLARLRSVHGIDLDDTEMRLRVHLALLILDV